MPGVQILPSAQPHPFAYQNTQAFTMILQTLGQYEGIRQKRMMNIDILSVLSRGGGAEDIAGVVQAHQKPQFDTGIRGVLQRIAAPFAQPPGAGITGEMVAQAIKPQQKTKIQELIDEGYTFEEARLARDISLGFEPRASSRLTYDNMTEVEKLKWLTDLKAKAEGQYYGIEGGNVEPRDPKLLDWTLRELNKLPQYREQKATTLETKRSGFLGRKESEFPEGFPPTTKGLLAEFKEIEKQLPPEKAKELWSLWDEAAKDNVTLKEFLKRWRSYVGE